LENKEEREGKPSIDGESKRNCASPEKQSRRRKARGSYSINSGRKGEARPASKNAQTGILKGLGGKKVEA